MGEGKYLVYSHTNKVNGKKYIGYTHGDPIKRWRSDGSGYLLKRNDHYVHPIFAPAILKYGWDSFSHEILFTDLTKEEAMAKEIELIACYKTNVVRYGSGYGYNCTDGGEGRIGGIKYDSPRKGKHLSEETRKKMSEYWKNYYSDPNNIKHGPETSGWGKHRSEEFKKMMSKRMSGGNHHSAKKVRCVETGEVFDTIKSAAESIGVAVSVIWGVCNGKRKTSGGFHWEYADLVAS